MLEISPVLAGTFDAPNYVPPNNVASTGGVDGSASVDTRRYTKFDHSATEAGSTTDFSFNDFLDLINPLQHIPVVSSVYREIAGETINPISRVTGDILYGGAFGIASAIMGGVGAAGDAVMEASNGKDSVGNVIASLFESNPSSPPAIQLADAGTTTPAALSTQVQSQTQASAQSPLAAPAPPPPPPPLPKLSSPPPLPNLASAKPNTPGALDPTTQALIASNAFALDPKKLPYGGVLDPSQLQGSTQPLVQAQAQALSQAQAQAQIQAKMQVPMMDPMQGSNMALALAASAPGPQMNHTIYAGGLNKGVKPSALLTSPQPQSQPVSGNPASNVTPVNAPFNPPPSANAGNPLPPELMQDIATLRAINQYKSTASQSVPTGANVNVVN